MAGPIAFPFHDSLALRIANLNTSDIELLEKQAFGAVSGWQSRFARPYKAHYANDISKRAQSNSGAMAKIVASLREFEAKAQAYMANPDRKGRPLTTFTHDPSAPDTLPSQPYRRSGKYAGGSGGSYPQGSAQDEPASEPVSADDQALLDALKRAMMDTITQAMSEGTMSADQIEQFKREAAGMTPEQMQQALESIMGKQQRGPDGKPIKRFNDPKAPQVKMQPQPAPKRATKDAMQQAMEGNAVPNVGEDRMREIAREEIEVAAPQILEAAGEFATEQINKRVPALIVAALAAMKPTRVEVTLPDGTVKDLGLQHSQFPMLLKTVTRFPVWLPGPAGSGKTTAARNASTALSVPFHHHGAVDNVYQLLGFIDAGGTYHATSFRKAYEHGGVFLWDEVDASNPAALVAFNAAIENGECVFPDATIARHRHCYFIAAANTYGTGATHEYVGRTKLDAATLDRFVMLDWMYDEQLERAIAGDTPWTTYVQQVRAACHKAGIKHLVTPRASIRGNDLLAIGIPPATVIDMTIRKGLAEDHWRTITRNTRYSAGA